MESLSDKLRIAREHACLSPTQAAELTGINYKTLNNYEHGVSKPDVGKLSAICKAYHVSADYFIQSQLDEIQKSSAPAEAETEEDNIKNKLFKSYMELNIEGREKLCGYADDLVMSGKYTKNNSSDVCADA